MPKISALGGMSSRGFGEFAQQTAANYIEDVFSTYLYNGTGASQTITNGIDLSGKGGLVWLKSRSQATQHLLLDTARGFSTGNQNVLNSSSTAPASNDGPGTTSVIQNGTASGFVLGTGSGFAASNQSTQTYASWTFRKQPKFFDVVTYTGTGVATTISHNLGSVPGMIIVKQLNTARSWQVYHRSIGSGAYIILNSTSAQIANPTRWNNTNPTSTVFSVGADTTVNELNGTYVAYLFAHNAGGFGADGSQNVISCGSYTGTGSYPINVDLGFEPQFVLVKCASGGTSDWYMLDTMRGMVADGGGSDDKELYSNTSVSEQTSLSFGPYATGFTVKNVGAINTAGSVYIYMAIRRGPMRTPTSGTSVFSPIAATTGTQTTSFPIDMQIEAWRTNASAILNSQVVDRLRGVSSDTTNKGIYLLTSDTSAENTSTNQFSSLSWNNTGFKVPQNYDGGSNIFWSFARAPGFFDVVCYTGNSTAALVNRAITHNLGVTPELIIIKSRSFTNDAGWVVGYNFTATQFDNGYLYNTNSSNPIGYNVAIFGAQPTSTTFTVLNQGATQGINNTNWSGNNYVAYLFASCPGVSKVGNYTGTGATQTINCGFTGGARYVMIKRINSTGSWWVWDTARGMVAGTDPRLAYNSTAAETNANWVYTTTGGFQIVTSDATVNASGGTYIYLAIA